MTHPEDRVAEALRAQARVSATGLPPRPHGDPRAALRRQITLALAVALLAGVLLGVGIALVSLLAPGVLPTVG
ncbi:MULTISPECIES: hypothetical protein [Pseudonocardia]|uniref:Uncharacterized protein n=1 Tax=Pseudonocardia oroxyli TaxID=366584 RepID=A0A1G7T5C2_PSEOR|nr:MULTISPECIES: hypothetical protein [Pseudonocardia]MCF7552106.1 hypothetical protein [Pseudonocardia sp. WMMC193]SDG30224.1 hypothetical protein SAMN05216377_110204 [Pseudonocardia oroxyli]